MFEVVSEKEKKVSCTLPSKVIPGIISERYSEENSATLTKTWVCKEAGLLQADPSDDSGPFLFPLYDTAFINSIPKIGIWNL